MINLLNNVNNRTAKVRIIKQKYQLSLNCHPMNLSSCLRLRHGDMGANLVHIYIYIYIYAYGHESIFKTLHSDKPNSKKNVEEVPGKTKRRFWAKFRLFSTHFAPIFRLWYPIRPHVYGLCLFPPIFRLFSACGTPSLL